VKTCGSCGVENPAIARFCLACGSPLAEAAPAQEHRKVVTIVFSDLKGSTSLGEALDSEALREVMTRYFEAMSSELERHGGVIEKFIGDAVMAVFGLPRLHEDDALRAVRAAAGMQTALEQLNDELEEVYGVRLTNRTGVNTGRVVAGDPTSGQRLVTGDAVNVAARLEQAAGEQEVLLGELTYTLVRDSVEVEEVEPLALKGKAEPVPAYRLVRVDDVQQPVRSAGRFVGRTSELEALVETLDEVATTRSARLATVIGDAGVGKSRLTAEFRSVAAEQATVLAGRCLPYGDGITFWPIAEAVRAHAGIVDDDDATEAYEKLVALAEGAGEGVAERLASAIGQSLAPFPMEELFWAVRRLLERLAAERPVVFVIEDVHWAEETLLDLIDHLVRSIDDAPVLLLCPTRPELVEERATWGEHERTTKIELEALDAGESRAMVSELLGGAALDEHILDRIVDAAEGNPLFAEQLLRMLTDEGLIVERDGAWHATRDLSEVTVPPSIQALLAARLDSLANDERAVIEPASVIGYQFPDDALSVLVPDGLALRIAPELATLEHKHLIRPLEDDEERGHRFHHIMIRDTAYDGILKRARADLHERFVAWADVANQDRGAEFEEILGYHLEQACQYLSELGPLDAKGREIGAEGARRLASAGRRAFTRGDMPGAVALLGRAIALLPEESRERLRLLPEHGEALLMAGRFEEASAVLWEAVSGAATAPVAAARASLVLLLVRLRTGGGDAWQREAVEREIAGTIEVFEAHDNAEGLAMAWRLLAWSAGTACRFGEAADASAEAVEHARRAGDVRQERRAATAYAAAASLGPTLVDDAIAGCESCLEQTTGDRQSEGNLLAVLGGLYAMQGAFDHARDLVARGRGLLEEIGLDVDAARAGVEAWRVEMLAGEHEAAARELYAADAALEALGERYFLSTILGLLAQTLLERGASLDDVDELCQRSRQLATDDDIATQAVWRCAQGRSLARRGSLVEAEAMVREALDLLARTDATVLLLDAYLDLGEVLTAAGRVSEAREAYETARGYAEVKGGVVPLSAVLDRLAQLDAASSLPGARVPD
jgi:predicted ATPase/class 3 adenylate cyclase